MFHIGVDIGGTFTDCVLVARYPAIAEVAVVGVPEQLAGTRSPSAPART